MTEPHVHTPSGPIHDDHVCNVDPIPVYLRVGTGSERRIGDIATDDQAQLNGDVSTLLRAAADEIDHVSQQPTT